MQDWYPEAVRQAAPINYWGVYSSGPFRGILHTTETTNPPRAGSYYGGTSYAHFTCGLVGGKFVCYQHIPVSRAARAMVNGPAWTQTNNDSAIQVEIMWHAANAPNMPVALLNGLRRLMRWIESNCGVKRYAYDQFHYYLPENGHRLGSEPWRMPLSVWDRFDGWCGHQHVPDGNVHGDPGKLDIGYLLDLNGGSEEEEVFIVNSPSWGTRQANGRFPRFEAFTEDGFGSLVVVPLDNSVFTPTFKPGKYKAYEDFSYLGLQWRRFFNTGKAKAINEVQGSMFVVADNGTYDIAKKP